MHETHTKKTCKKTEIIYPDMLSIQWNFSMTWQSLINAQSIESNSSLTSISDNE
jgi:hypothetical protein